MILTDARRFDRIHESGSLEGALRFVSELGPALGLVILDLGLADASGLSVLDRMVEACGDTPILVVSGESDPDLIDSAFALGARGFVSKNASGPALRVAVDSVIQGELYVPAEVLRVRPSPVPTLASAIDFPRESSPTSGLTPRQEDVLRLVAKGLANKEIADELGMSPATVRVHVTALFKTLGVENRTQAALSAAARALANSAPRR